MEDETLPPDPARSDSPDQAPLRRIAGYDVIEELGQGAMGVVYRARDLSLGREVALKILKSHLLESTEAVERFRREAAAAARITHPNLLPIFEIGQDNGCWFFTMELASDETLLDITLRRADRGAPAPVEQDRPHLAAFLRHFAEVCDALHLAHEHGILHRDIKSSNILIADDGTMKLVDFGLAKDLEVEQMTMTGAMLGTPLYMSPEQIAGDITSLDRRSDVYSLGVTLYEALTLRKPFETTSLATLMGKILAEDPPGPRELGLRFPRDLEAVLFKAMEKDRDQRYSTAAEFAADLRRFVDYEPVLARPQGAWLRLRKRMKRNRRVVRAAAVTTLAVVLLVLLPTFLSLGEGWYQGIRSAMVDREAWKLYGQAMVEPPAMRAELLASLVATHPSADAHAGALLSLGRARLALTEREGAQAAWAEAYLAAPDTAAGQHALLDLARTFHEIGGRHQAEEAVGDVLARPVTPTVEARALLLAGEIALSADRPGEARRLLDQAARISRDTGLAVNPRISLVSRVLVGFLPSRSIEAQGVQRVLAGCFRNPERSELLLIRKGSCEFIRLDANGSLVREPLALDLGNLNCDPQVGDLDGDGLDDLAIATSEGDWNVEERLRAWSLRDGEPRRLCNLVIPHTNYTIAIGDFDGDGTNDLLLVMSYPRRGVLAFRNLPAKGFVPQALGDLARVGETNSDARDVIICDLDGDGRHEVVVAAEAFGLFSAYVARFKSVEEGFEELSVSSLAALDTDRDGRDEVYFGLESFLYPQLEDRYASMLPQGLYRATFDGDGEKLEVTPLDQYRQIRFRSGDPMLPLPMNLGIGEVIGGRSDQVGPFLITRRRGQRGMMPSNSFLAIQLPGAFNARPILLPGEPVSRRAAMCCTDLDHDGDDEIVILGKDRLQVYGLGGTIESRTPPPPSAVPPGSQNGQRHGLSVADRLRALEHCAQAEAAYQSVLEQDPYSLAGAEAMEGLISIRGSIRDFDRCLELVRQYEHLHPGRKQRARYLRANYRFEQGEIEAAMVDYTWLRDVRGLNHVDQTRADCLAALLAPWAEVTEISLEDLARVSVSAPGTFSLGEDGELRGRNSSEQATSLWWPIEWRGGSFRLEFDLRMDGLGWSRGMRIGFQKLTALRRSGEGVYFYTGHSSTMPRGGSLCLRSLKAGASENWSQRSDIELPLGKWLHYNLVYDCPAHTARLAVRDEEGRSFSFLRIDPDFEVNPTGFRLSIVVRAGDAQKEIAFAFRSLKLFHPKADHNPPLGTDAAPEGLKGCKLLERDELEHFGD